jgi:hypothetical protein
MPNIAVGGDAASKLFRVEFVKTNVIRMTPEIHGHAAEGTTV